MYNIFNVETQDGRTGIKQTEQYDELGTYDGRVKEFEEVEQGFTNEIVYQ